MVSSLITAHVEPDRYSVGVGGSARRVFCQARWEWQRTCPSVHSRTAATELKERNVRLNALDPN
jgi:hypothetical protein